MDEATDQKWSHLINGDEFIYSSQEYRRFYPALLEIEATLEYQVSPYWSNRLGVEFREQAYGWNESAGIRVATPVERNLWITAGADLIAGRSVWYRQELSIPISGSNSVTPFMLRSRFTFNRFAQ